MTKKTNKTQIDVQVYPIEANKDRKTGLKTKALVRVLVNGIQLTGIRIVEKSAELYVYYPNDPSFVGNDFQALFYPATKALKIKIEKAVFKQYIAVTSV